MKKLIVGVVLIIQASAINISSFGQCNDHLDKANSPHIQSAIDEVYSLLLAHELITQPLSRKDISLNDTDFTKSVACVKHGKIIISTKHINDNMKMLGDLSEESENGSEVNRDRLVRSLHPVISHQYAHLQHHKFSLFHKGKKSAQHSEYHADFMAGYLNGRSTWLNSSLKTNVLCGSQSEEYIKMVKSVLDKDKAGMREAFQCLVNTMDEYEKVNSLIHDAKGIQVLAIERKKAYINGFATALNYEILSWNRGEDEAIAKWIEFFYEPLPEAKKRFSRNLFSFLGEELNIMVDKRLIENPMSPAEVVDKGYAFISESVQI